MKRLSDFIKKCKELITREELGILPASLTYYFVLAIIPILTLTVLIASSFNISVDRVITIISEMLPYKVSSFVIDIISGRGFDTNIGIFNVVAFFVASNGTYAIIKTANNLYKVPNNDMIKNRIKSVIILLNIIMLIIFMVLVPMFGEEILQLCKSNEVISGLTDKLILVLNILKWPFTFFILFVNIKLIYTISPSKQIMSKNTTIGALFTATLWIISTIILGYYLKYLAHYDILYGNLSSIIILMIWLYILSFVFVFGMIINITYYNDEQTKD